MENPKRIVITGGSSGIGEGLAHAYAKPGVFLAITGRNQGRLESVANELRAKGAEVEARLLNVTDETAMAVWIKELDEVAPIDLVIANAGIGISSDTHMSLHGRALATFDVNVTGVFNTVHPALELMKKRKTGQIAIMSSIAGFLGIPGAPAYSASKNAVRAYGEALRGSYAKQGIEVNVICPGYVVSRLTDTNKFSMPFLMQTDRAAEIIRKGLASNKARIGFPWQMYTMIRLLQALPYIIADKLLPKGGKK